MTKKIVGLDLGSNSIGWSVLESIKNSDGKDEIVNIIAAGSRIVPMDPDFIKEFETGQKITKNAKRRQMRGARRLLQRYHQRREKLVEVFKQMKIIESAIQLQKNELITEYEEKFKNLVIDGKAKPVWYHYFLRNKALTEKVSLQDLAIILYHLNQRRGYKDIGELMNELAGVEEKEEKSYTKSFEIVRIVNVNKEDDLKGKKELFSVLLEDGRSCLTTVKALSEMIGQEKELEIRVRTNKKGDVSYELALPDNAAWQYRLDAMDKKLESDKLTPGSYFWNRLISEPNYRVKQNLIYRERYLHEYDLIMKTQERFHPELSDKRLFFQIVKSLIPTNKSEQNRWKGKSLKSLLRDYIIYYQRPLKSQRRLLDVCRFEKGYKGNDKNGNEIVRPALVLPISHPLFQEFRLWQDLSHLGFKDQLDNVTLLTNAEKTILFEELIKVSELSQASIYKLLGKDKKIYPGINKGADAKLIGNTTLHILKKALSKVPAANITILEDDDVTLERIWHLLFSVADQKARLRSLIKQFGFTEAEGKALSSINLPKGHGNLSYKAVKKLLPLMRCGKYYTEKDICEEALNRINDISVRLIDIKEKASVTHTLKANRSVHLKKEDDDLTNEERNILKICSDRYEISDFQGLKYWEAAWLVYGAHSSFNEDQTYQNANEIKRLPLHSLRNPVVEQVVNEALMVMKDIWLEYGKPDEVVVELAREMKMTAEDRKKMTEAFGKNERERARVAKILEDEFGIKNPSRKAILKYQLWDQQKKRCIYSGNDIQKSDLFSGAVEVDHIIPRQRYFDDSQNNKVLAFESENSAKSNKTAYEYMHETNRWEIFYATVEGLKRSGLIKKQKFKYLTTDKIPEDFVNRQLQETRYIAAKMTTELKKITPKVRSSIGLITDHLKQSWRLNEVFKEVQLSRFERLQKLYPQIQWIQNLKDKQGHSVLQLYGWEKRIDHRHHALDAIIVGCTTYNIVNQLNRLNALYGQLHEQGRPAQHFPLPFIGFYQRLREVLSGIIVSVKCTDKLANKGHNTINKLDPKTQRYFKESQNKTGWAVKGALHDEQPLGQVIRQEKVPLSYVLDKLSKHPELLNETSKEKKFLAVEWQRETIKKHLNLFGGDFLLMKNSLKKKPLLNDYGKAIEHITVWKRYYSKNRTIDTSLTLNQVELIIDSNIKKGLKELLEQHGKDPKKAFTTDHLLSWNANRKNPVFTVKCRLDESEVGTSEGRTPLASRPEKHYTKFVEKGDNYALIVEEDLANHKRTFQVLSFFDAVDLKMNGISMFSDRPDTKSFILRKGSLVYVPLPGESPESVRNIDHTHIVDRLYKVVKFSGSRFYFIPAYVSTVINIKDEKKVLEYGTPSCTEFHGDDASRIKIGDVCLPVSLNRLGKILKVG